MDQMISGYRVLRPIGHGGMGSVYLVENPQGARHEALKLVAADLSTDAVFRARFEREANILSQLNHPNVVHAYDRGESQGRLWLTMEYVDGPDAATLLDEQRQLSLGQVADIVSGVASALDYAWASQRLTHRDVKPANILVRPGVPGPDGIKLADFGVATGPDRTRLTQSGHAVGTLWYLAPESLTDVRVNDRSDQYSLACTAYHLLTGYPPFGDRPAADMMRAHMSETFPTPSASVPGLPSYVDDAIARATSKEPSERFSSSTSFANALRGKVLDRTTMPLVPVVPAPVVPAPAPAPLAGRDLDFARSTAPAGPQSPTESPPPRQPTRAMDQAHYAAAANGPGANSPGANGPNRPGGPPQYPHAPYAAAGYPGVPQPGSQYPPSGPPPGGYRPDGAAGPDPSGKPDRKMAILIGAVAGVLLLIVAVVGGIMLFSGNDDPDPRPVVGTSTTTSSESTSSSTSTTTTTSSTTTSNASVSLAALDGTWKGTYSCRQGETALTLTFRDGGDRTTRATFAFGPTSSNPSVSRGSYDMYGLRLGDDVTLTGLRWNDRPDGYEMVPLLVDGPITEDMSTLTGKVVDSGCTSFRVTR